MSFARDLTSPPALSTSTSASSLQHDELDIIMMSYYMDEANGGDITMKIDPEESFSPDTFWQDDDAVADNFGGNGRSAMDFLRSQHTSNCSTASFSTSDAFSSTSSFFYDPSNTTQSAQQDKEAIAQRIQVLDQKLAASMKRSEASRARILELKISRACTLASSNINATSSDTRGTPTASPSRSSKCSTLNETATDADKTAAFLIESRTSLTAALEQSRQQPSRFSSSAMSA